MAIIKNIYLDDKASKELEDKKKQNPNFNFSEFIRNCLLTEQERVNSKEERVKEIELQILNRVTSINILNEEIKNLNENINRLKEENGYS